MTSAIGGESDPLPFGGSVKGKGVKVEALNHGPEVSELLHTSSSAFAILAR